MYRLLALTLLAALVCGNAPAAELELTIERLRSKKGLLHICLTRQAAHFPDCKRDPRAMLRTVSAGIGPVRLTGLAPGAYAVSVFHDENANRKLDTLLGVPREGFAFSRNPVVRFGAPRFRQVVIDLRPGFSRQAVRMQYLL